MKQLDRSKIFWFYESLYWSDNNAAHATVLVCWDKPDDVVFNAYAYNDTPSKVTGTFEWMISRIECPQGPEDSITYKFTDMDGNDWYMESEMLRGAFD